MKLRRPNLVELDKIIQRLTLMESADDKAEEKRKHHLEVFKKLRDAVDNKDTKKMWAMIDELSKIKKGD